VRRLIVIADIVPSSLILNTLMLEALSSSETSILTGATQHYFTEDYFFIAIAVKTPKSYINLFKLNLVKKNALFKAVGYFGFLLQRYNLTGVH
jgi:hypothetical protein